MRLRKLMEKDAPMMLEWMHDSGVVSYMNTDFGSKTLEDCVSFIAEHGDENTSLHLAVTDEQDIYMGTASLKHIDMTKGTAEFAITVRSCAMGLGYASFAMKEILTMGLTGLNLHAVYWCVAPENERAVRFYDKNGFSRVREIPQEILDRYTPGQQKHFYWYCCRKSS